MGVYIKDMKMPTSCYNCWALDDYGDYPRCRITEEQRGYTFPIREKRMDNCPLVPVPPHGRLIDGDYLKHTHCAECTLYPDKCLEKTEDGCDWGSIIHLRMCPTIIEAEEGE